VSREPWTIHSLTWTSFNLPATMTQGANYSSYTYGPDRERIRQSMSQSLLSGSMSKDIVYAGGLYESHSVSGVGAGAFGKSYVRAGGQVVAIFNKPSGAAGAFQYLHYDHLDSVEVVTDAQGTVIERLSYDAFGKRRNTNWLNDTSDLQLKVARQTDRGYTSQEQLDAVGLIHYGGRVYDPVLGRFTSADPFIQAPTDVQSYNRYAYVRNNPLSLTDPSGFFSFRKWVKQAGHIVGATFGGPLYGIHAGGDHLGRHSKTWNAINTIVMAKVFGPPGAAAYSAYSTKRRGGTWEMAGRSAFVTGWTAYAFQAVGTVTAGDTIGMQIANTISHGVVGGMASVAQGGSFGAGFASGALPAAAGHVGLVPKDPTLATVASAVIGGTSSVLSGGKFANGAITGAFGYLFNHYLHNSEQPEGAVSNDVSVTTNSDMRVKFLESSEPRRLLGFLLDALAEIKRGVAMSFEVPHYEKVDTLRRQRQWYVRGSDQVTHTEWIGGEYTAVDYGGTYVRGFEYVGNGLYIRPGDLRVPVMDGRPMMVEPR
jgi:RHS repeat-associated protein